MYAKIFLKYDHNSHFSQNATILQNFERKLSPHLKECLETKIYPRTVKIFITEPRLTQLHNILRQLKLPRMYIKIKHTQFITLKDMTAVNTSTCLSAEVYLRS